MTDPQQHPLYYELPLRRAALWTEDNGVDWIELLPVVLEAFPQITPDAYWNLTVAEALALKIHLDARGVSPGLLAALKALKDQADAAN